MCANTFFDADQFEFEKTWTKNENSWVGNQYTDSGSNFKATML